MMNDSIPELKIEAMDDSHGSLILLEQDSGGNIDRVAIHPIHLRYMAEKWGLVESSDPQAQKTIATLERRLRLLSERINHLASYLCLHSDSEHADLRYEQDYANATSDIVDEFCADFAPVSLSAPDADNRRTLSRRIADIKASPDADPRQMAIEV